MRKQIGFLSGIALALALASPVAAGQPASHACLGRTVSAAAQSGADFGRFVAAVARDTRGVGEEVQVVLAGEFPDDAFPNTCND
jgi:hypothetical protein